MEKEIWINGIINTEKDAESWLMEFINWVEDRNETAAVGCQKYKSYIGYGYHIDRTNKKIELFNRTYKFTEFVDFALALIKKMVKTHRA